MTRPLHELLSGRPAPLAHHVTLALEGRRLLTDEPGQRRLLARIVYENLEGRGLVSFGAADDHLHVLLARDRVACGALVRTLASAIKKRLRHVVPFERSRFRPVENMHHERNTYFYTFGQERRHGTRIDPFFDATSLPDRIGARVLLTPSREPLRSLLGRATAITGPVRPLARNHDDAAVRGATVDRAGPRVRVLGAATSQLAARRLPRIGLDDLLLHVGGPGVLTVPIVFDELADAAAAAVGLGSLDSVGPAAVLARRAAIHLARASMTTRDLADALRTPLRTIQRDATSPTLPSLRRAIDLQLRMRSLGTANEPPIAMLAEVAS
jgi:hypothetical protein